MAGEVREKCAVAGVITANGAVNAAEAVGETLFATQHRGAESTGTVSETYDGDFRAHRARGLVVDVYDREIFRRLAGRVAVGHNRYSTSGAKDGHLAPFTDEATRFALSLNGNLPSTSQLEKYLSRHGIYSIKINDTEMAGHALAQHLRNGSNLPEAVKQSYPLFTGAFSCVAMHDGTLAAFRDSHGIRPLAIGTIDGGYAVASETCGLDTIGASYLREVEPGEMVIITQDGVESHQIAEGEHRLDMFEFVYFARHDSYLYGKSVNEVRRRFGEQLALEHPPLTDDPENIVVIPVPDTSVPASEGYADRLRLRKSQGLIKNRYIHRTFMQPTTDDRRKNSRLKHNIIPEVVTDRDVIFIDDSIVRLNTMPRLVELAYASGARSVTVLIASPPVRFPDFYGIDTPTQSELAAAHMTVEEMRQKMGNGQECIHLGFLSLQGMVDATELPAGRFNLSCFTGDYPIDIGEHRKEIVKPVSMSYVE